VFSFDNSLPSCDDISEQLYKIFKEYYDNHPEINGTQSIVIGHSQGGAVLANLNRQDHEEGRVRSFGAFAAFGSPMEGAPVLDNIDCLEDIIEDFCTSLKSFLVLDCVKSALDKDSVKRFLEDFLGKELVDVIEDPINNPEALDCREFAANTTSKLVTMIITPSARRDLSPGSAFIQKLKSHTMDVPGLAVIGSEEDPVSLRVMFSARHDVNFPTKFPVVGPSLTTDYFTADYDELYVVAMDRVLEQLDVYLDMAESLFEKSEVKRPKYMPKSAFCELCKLFGGTCTFNKNLCYSKCARMALFALVSIQHNFQDFDRRYRYCYGFDTYHESPFKRVVCRCYKEVGGVRVEIDAYDGPCDPGRLSGFDCQECRRGARRACVRWNTIRLMRVAATTSR